MGGGQGEAMSAIARNKLTSPPRVFLLAALLGILLLLLPGCSREDPPTKVDLSKRVPNASLIATQDNTQFSFGIGSMITPKEGFKHYRQFVSYLGQKLELPIRTIERGTYEEVNELLEKQQLDAAFICGGPYVEGKESFDLELLVLPEGNDGPVYYSYLIIPSNSSARSLADLRGKKFAFTDPKSNSGMIVPTYWLATMGETPDSFFSKHIFTYAHDASIRAVMENLVDGAAVDSLIWDYMNNQNPAVGIKTRIIKISEPFGIPPLVVRPDLPLPRKEQLKQVLLNMHNDPDGKKILDGLHIKRFVIGKDSDYDSIRKMRDFLSQKADNR